MNNINIPQAIETIRQASVEIQKLGEELKDKRLKHAVARAKFIDKENEARKFYFEKKPCKATELRDWLKFYTSDVSKPLMKLDDEIRRLREEMEVRIEILNATKFVCRLWELEAKNLEA